VLQEAQKLICKKLGLPMDAGEEKEQLRQRYESSFDSPCLRSRWRPSQLWLKVRPLVATGRR
jgi:hypothetical protein